MQIPYRAEEITKNNERKCAAAALQMVYHSFGLTTIQQFEVWRKIKTKDARGNWYSRTHALARDARLRGLHSLVVKLSDEHRLSVLRRCLEHGVRVILNYRVDSGSPLGHFTVLVDVKEDAIVVHDTEQGRGPNYRVKFGDLWDLWRPLGIPGDEITGNVIVAISNAASRPSLCSSCGMALPRFYRCPNCSTRVELEPFVVLGCVHPDCCSRTWELIFCAECDTSIDESHMDSHELD